MHDPERNAHNTTPMMPWKRPYLFPFIAIAAIAVFGFVVMALWNAILPGLTGWGFLTYPKAVGLLVLSKILFGGFRGRPHGGRSCGGPGMRGRWGAMGDPENMGAGAGAWREKWKGMNEEERARMREMWRTRCGKPDRSESTNDRPA